MAQKFSEISMIANQFAQRLAVDMFRRNEVRTIVLADIIDMSNVRVVKRRRGFSFPNEPLHSVAIRGHFRRQNLQRNFAIQLCIMRQIHFTHSALANLCADFVTAKSYTGGKRHDSDHGDGITMRRSRSAKRGSERRLSNLGSTLRRASVPSRSLSAFSSQVKARSLSPRAAHISAIAADET